MSTLDWSLFPSFLQGPAFHIALANLHEIDNVILLAWLAEQGRFKGLSQNDTEQTMFVIERAFADPSNSVRDFFEGNECQEGLAQVSPAYSV